MGKQTVKGRIFRSNTLTVLVILVIFLMINAAVIKVYSEFIEHELWTSMGNMADGLVCIAVLVIVSRLFTKRLADHIMEPLDALSDGAEQKKIKSMKKPEPI